MTPRLEYTSGGTVGLIVPRESTTVEPELSVLLAPEIAILATKMPDIAGTPFERIRANARDLAQHVASFGKAPIDVFAFALTASGYLLPDAALPDTVAGASGPVPMVWASAANRAALAALGAKRIALVSPYWKELTEAAVAYWTAHDVTVAEVVSIGPAKRGHVIYGLRGAEILDGIRRVSASGVDAMLVTGTGAPSLGALAAVQAPGKVPVISSNFCMGWQIACRLDPAQSGALDRWMAPDAAWKAELRRRYPRAVAELAVAG